MKKVIVVPLLCILGACAFIPDFYSDRPAERNSLKTAKTYSLSDYPQTVYLGERVVKKTNYRLNERMYSRIGDPVVRIATYRQKEFEHNAFELSHPVKVLFGVENFNIRAGTYHVIGTVEIEGGQYLVLNSPFKYHLLMSSDGTLSTHTLYEHEDGVFQMPYERILFRPAKPRLTKKSEISRDAVPLDDYEVVYDGIKDNKLVFFYKKSVPGSNGNAGSFDTLTFPADATMINLVGVMMQVIRADSEHIEYMILKEY